MKLNLTLTGEVDVALYEHRPESEFPTTTVGHVRLPGKLTLAITDEFCRFNFWDYPGIDVAHCNPAGTKVARKGKFSLRSLCEPIRAYKSNDMSGVEWRRFSAKGDFKWVIDAQKFTEFSIEIPNKSNDLFIHAFWPQRAYPRGPLEMRSQSVIMSLDGLSLDKLSSFLDAVKGGVKDGI